MDQPIPASSGGVPPPPGYTPAPPPAAPAPAYYPPPAPPPAPDVPQYKQGGVVGPFDWVEIGFMIVALWGMFTVVRYYNNREKANKQVQSTVNDLGASVNKLEHAMNGMRKGMVR